jgi:hypothetical protein
LHRISPAGVLPYWKLAGFLLIKIQTLKFSRNEEMSKLTNAFLIASALIVGAAQATVIDFTDADLWSTSGTPRTESYGDLDVTLIAYDRYGTMVPFTNTTYDGKKPCESYGGLGLACERDGIGIGDDEVSFGIEMLQVSFSSAVDIKSITLLDLFAYSGSDPYAEQAVIGLGPLTASPSYGVWEGTADNDRTGFFTADLDNAIDLTNSSMFDDVTTLYFGSHGAFGSPRFSDFALAAIEIIDVPEPGSFALLGIGLISLYGARRQQKKKSA